MTYQFGHGWFLLNNSLLFSNIFIINLTIFLVILLNFFVIFAYNLNINKMSSD